MNPLNNLYEKTFHWLFVSVEDSPESVANHQQSRDSHPAIQRNCSHSRNFSQQIWNDLCNLSLIFCFDSFQSFLVRSCKSLYTTLYKSTQNLTTGHVRGKQSLFIHYQFLFSFLSFPIQASMFLMYFMTLCLMTPQKVYLTLGGWIVLSYTRFFAR